MEKFVEIKNEIYSLAKLISVTKKTSRGRGYLCLRWDRGQNMTVLEFSFSSDTECEAIYNTIKKLLIS